MRLSFPPLKTVAARLAVFVLPTLVLTTLASAQAPTLVPPIYQLAVFAGSSASGPTGGYAPNLCPSGSACPASMSGNGAGVSEDPSGNFYLPYQAGHEILQWNPSTGFVTAYVTGLSNPIGTATDSSGNLYIADSGTSSVYYVPVGSTAPVTTPVQITGAALSGTPEAIAVSPAGALYAAIGNSIYVFSGNTASSTATALTISGAALNAPSALAFDSFGNLYVANKGGNNALVLTLTGTNTYTSAALTLTAFSISAPSGIVVDGANNIYILAKNTGNSAIQVIEYSAAGVTSAVAGSGSWPSVSTNSYTPPAPASEVLLSSLSTGAMGLTLDNQGRILMPTAAGQVWVMPAPGLGMVFPATAVGSSVTRYWYIQATATPGSSVSATFSNFVSDASAFARPAVAAILDVTHGSSGNLCSTSNGVTDYNLGSPKNGYCEIDLTFSPTVAGSNSGAFIVTDNATPSTLTLPVRGAGLDPILAGTIEQINTPLTTARSGVGLNGLAVNPWGNLFAADNLGGAIEELSGGTLATVASGGHPSGIAFDPSGNLYYADASAGTLYEIPVAVSSAGAVSYGSSATAVAAASGLSNAEGVAIDAYGNIYIADYNHHEIKKYSNGALTVIAGTGAAGVGTVTSAGALATATQLEYPYGIAVDAGGNVYFVDQTSGEANGRVLRLTNGYLYPVASSFPTTPWMCATDPAGDLYVQTSAATYLITAPASASPVAAIIAGTGVSAAPSGDGGPATFATLNFGVSIALVPSKVSGISSDTLYIGDYNAATVDQVRSIATANGAYVPAFPATTVGSTEAGNLVPLFNAGNASLNAGNSLSQNHGPFSYNQDTAASADGGLCSNATPLAPGWTCTLSMTFQPTAVGTFGYFEQSGVWQFTTPNNYSLSYPATPAQLTLYNSGTATAPVVSATQLAFTPAPYATLALGGNPGSVTVSLEDSNGNVSTNDTANVTLTITGSGGYSYSSTVAAGAGVATFTGVSNFTTAGTYTYTAASAGLTSAAATTTVEPSTASPPSEPVGTPAPTTPVTFAFNASTTVGSYAVVTGGYTGLDFTDAGGGSCPSTATLYGPGTSCTVNVAFTPTAVGTRRGAVILYDGSGNVLQTVFLSGTGQGSVVRFNGAVSTSYAASGPPVLIAVDAKGNVFYSDGTVAESANTAGTLGATQSFGSFYSYAGGATAIDGAGNIFLFNQGTNGLYEISSSNGVVNTNLASAQSLLIPGAQVATVDAAGNVFAATHTSSNSPTYVYEVPAGTLTPVELAVLPGNVTNPQSIAVDANDDVFVAVAYNPNIYEVANATSATPTVSVAYTATGQYALALAFDATGNLYYGDYLNGKVYEAPLVSGALNFSSPTLLASISNVRSIAFDGAGNMYLGQDSGFVTVYSFATAPALPNFGNINVGASSGVEATAVSNVGNENLTFSSVSFPTPVFTDGGTTCTTSASVAPGATCQVEAQFTPASAGSASGSVTLSDNAANETGAQLVALAGTGIQQSQTIAFNLASPVTYGVGTVNLAATGGGSGNAIVYSIVSGPATLSGANLNILNLNGAGAVVVAANQAGNTDYLAAAQVEQTLVVNPAPLTITASNGSMTYGGTVPTVTAAYNGFVNGETASVLGAVACVANVTAASPANGSYTSSCSGAADANYAIAYVNGTVTVGPAALTITASNGAMTYGGTVPTITAAYGGFVNGQTASVLGAVACVANVTAASPANGSYTSSCSGAADANYAIAYVNGTVTVSPAALTITASNGAMTYGGTVPTITATYGGFVNGQTASVLGAVACVANVTAASPANGSYTSSCSGAADGNYSISYVNGAVTVAAAPLSITASNATMTYGGTVPAITAAYGGFVNGQTASVLGTVVCVANVSSSSTPGGAYTSSCSGAADANYAITYVNGVVTVNTAPPSTGVVLNPVSGIAYGVAQTATVTVSGGGPVKPSGSVTLTVDTTTLPSVTLVNGVANFTLPADLAAGVNHSVTANYLGDTNYSAATDGVSDQVVAASQTVTIASPLNGASFQYPDSTIPLSASATSGLANFNWTVLSGPGTITGSGSTLKLTGVGAVVVQATQPGSQNYLTASATATYNATAAATTITASASPQNSIYNPSSSIALKATVASVNGLAAPTGTVLFFLNSASVGSANLSGGVASVNLAGLAGGSYSLTESYSGDSNYLPENTTVTYTVAVTAATQSVTFPALSEQTYSGTPIVLTLAATASSGEAVTYSVTAGGSIASVNGNQLTITGPGEPTILATAAATNDYNQATASRKVLINQDGVAFGPQPVGTPSAPQTVTFVLPGGSNGQTLSVRVVTQGATGLDYQPASDTCSGQTIGMAGECTVGVSFDPLAPGLRPGAIELLGNGSVLQTEYLGGTGTGPVAVFNSGSPALLAFGSLANPVAVLTDAAGDVFALTPGALYELPAGASSPVTVSLANPLNAANGIALDGAGNLYLADGNGLSEVPNLNGALVGSSETVVVPASQVGDAYSVAVDGSGNVFASFLPALNGQQFVLLEGTQGGSAPITLVTGKQIEGLAVDAAGDLYYGDFTDQSVIELPNLAGAINASAPTTLVSAHPAIRSLAVDAAGELYLADETAVSVVPAGGGAPVALNTTGVGTPWGLALDGNANVYVTGVTSGGVYELSRQSPAALAFGNVIADTTSASQTVVAGNAGNTGLDFYGLALGTANFSLAGTACSTSTAVGPGATCNLVVAATPHSLGALADTLALTDNSLNAPSASPAAQNAALSVTGIAGAPASVSVTGGNGQSATVGSNFGASLTVNVTDANGFPVSNATVAFAAPASGATAVVNPTATTDSSGNATSGYVTAGSLAGSYTVTATSGTGSAGFSLTNTAAIPGVVLTTPPPATYGQPLVISVTVTGVGSLPNPTGTVQLYDGAALVGTDTLNGAPAIFTLLNVAAGSHNYRAVYSGDGTYAQLGTLPSTFAVAQAVLTVSANSASKLYGAALPTFSGTVAGQQYGDAFTETFSTSATAASTVGPYNIVPAVTGAALSNYTVNVVPGTLTVNPAPLTITADNKTSVYGQTLPPYTGTVTGAVNGDVITETFATTPATPTTAGTYTITPTAVGSALSNYTVTATPGTLTITQATPVLAWPNGTITYGAKADSAARPTSGGVAGKFTYTANGNPVTGNEVFPAGTYTQTATFTPADTTDYASATVSNVLTVSPAALIITADNKTSVYGQTLPPYTGTVTGAVNGDVITEIFATTPATPTTAGTYTITPTAVGSALSNYTVTATPGTLTITQATPVLAWPNGTITYGAKADSAARPTSGGVAGKFAYTANGNPVTGNEVFPAGTYTQTATFTPADTTDYASATVSNMLTVSPAPLTITASNGTMVYGGVPPSITPSYSGFVSSDTASVLGTVACVANVSVASPVGTTYTSSCSGAVDANYAIGYGNGSVSVTPAAVSITASNGTMVYGGTVPTITPTITGLLNSQSSSVLGTIICVANVSAASPVGSTYTSSCSGAVDANYAIGYGNGSVSVTPATLTITANNAAIAYGVSLPTFTGTVAGQENGDTFTESFTTSATSSSPAGTYTIVPAVAGSKLANYTVIANNGTLTITVAPDTLTIAPIQPINYPLNVPVVLSATGSSTGAITFALTSGPGSITSVNGVYYLHVNGAGTLVITAAQAADSNYLAGSATLNVTVNPASPVITFAPGATTLIYGAALTPGTAPLNATVNDGAAGAFTYVATPASGPAVTIAAGTVLPTGAYTLSVSFLPSNTTNYLTPAPVTSGAITVNAAPAGTLTFSPSPGTIEPNTSLTAGTLDAVLAGADAGNGKITYAINGSPLGVGQTLAPGTYTVTATFTPTGATATDYIAVTATATITVANPLALTVPATAAYGSVIPLAATGGIGPYTYALVSGSATVSGNTLTVTGGSGAIVVKATDSKGVTVTATLTAAKAVLTLAANPVTCVYGTCDGDNDSDDVVKLTYSVEGLLNGQTAAQVLSGTPSESTTIAQNQAAAVGTYTITLAAGSVRLTAAYSGFYTLAYANSTYTITPATLTVAATSQSDVYGQIDPDNCGKVAPHLAYTVSGLAWGMSQQQVLYGSPAESTPALPTSGVGTYPITIAAGTLKLNPAYAADYTIVYVNGTLTVTPANLTVVANSYSRIAGQANPALGYTIAGFVNADTQANALTGAPVLSTSATASSPAGNYVVTIAQGSLAARNGNYTFTFVNGLLIVYNPNNRNDQHCDGHGNYQPNPVYDCNNWQDPSSFNYYWGGGKQGPNVIVCPH